ncbi:D-amino-acid dehydrogenase [Lederbergia galactosidilyticus]|uniref:NAD(P)/FAD-dependent oxidoreductase n=1 Tax=Lederbergia galactosidilytica TaxID=217031 RepID=UPI001AE83C4F|nr:FAD-binding oxidoreductase [Lederbergia galactosidilytica]MBP1916958.1 D-amino-acid dehydrogenase [Lederbergia galactosidilytica]
MNKYIIIGAGILGASTAYHLAKAGADVTVIDRRDEGQATQAAAGIVCPWLSQRRNQAWYQLAKSGAAYYPQLIAELENAGETNTGYAQVGALSLHTDRKKLQAMEQRAIERRKDAPEIGDIQLLTTDEAKKMFPPLADRYGAVYISGAARVDGAATRDALLRAAESNGAMIVRGNACLQVSGKKIVGVHVDGREFSCNTALVANGAWAKELFEPLGIQINVDFQKGQIIHMQAKSERTDKWPVIMPPGVHYIVPFSDGRIAVGVTHENNTGFDVAPTVSGMHEIFEKASEVAPGLSKNYFLDVKVGFRPFTPGFLPIIGPLPDYEGIYLANGLGSSGLTVGPYLGAQLAKLALGEKLDISLEHYSVLNALN